MDEKTAIRQLQEFMIALQRYRGIIREQMSDIPDKVLVSLEPWVFGDKCPLEILVKVLDGVDTGHALEPMTYYNMMTILTNFMPGVQACVNMRLAEAGLALLPEMPDINILRGWSTLPQED